MSVSASTGHSPHPLIHGLGASTVALLTGLPFLYVIVRASVFYGYADVSFGFWVATIVLPIWAAVAVGLGVLAGMIAVRRNSGLVWTLVLTAASSVFLASTLTVAGLRYSEPKSTRNAGQDGLPAVKVTHFVRYHLFGNPQLAKLDFDPCIFDDDGLYGPPGKRRALSYEFCIPDSNSFLKQVSAIDPTILVMSSPGRSACGSGDILCVGNSRQLNVTMTLNRLVSLPYVRRIRQSTVE